MRRYYIISGILLILPVIDFAVAAPVLVQEECQAGVDVMRIPEDAITMLGKRGELPVLLDLFGNPGESDFVKLEDSAKPESSSAARPSSSSPPSPPADGWTNVKQPLPSIPEEPPPVSSPDHALPSPDNESNEPWRTLFGHPKPEESPSSPPLAPADGWTDVNVIKQPLPSTNPDGQSMSEDSPSGKRRKMDKNWSHL